MFKKQRKQNELLQTLQLSQKIAKMGTFEDFFDERVIIKLEIIFHQKITKNKITIFKFLHKISLY